MIYGNCDIFNAAEVVATSDGGVMFPRFSGSAVSSMSELGRTMAMRSSCVEIRFSTDAKRVRFTLGGGEESTRIFVYCGDYKYQSFELAAGEKRDFEYCEVPAFSKISDKKAESRLYRNRYSRNVWRIVISDMKVVFYGVSSEGGTYMRPPMPSELPKHRMIAYGSSISHGCWSDSYYLGYVQIAAEMCGIDIENKGLSGSCRYEHSVADYIASADFDSLFLELGTNMSNPKDFSVAEVTERIGYFINTVCTAHPDAPIICCTPYVTERRDLISAITQKVGELTAKYPNLHLFCGNRIYKRKYYACYDIVHPSEFGHIRMAENLAKIIKEVLRGHN